MTMANIKPQSVNQRNGQIMNDFNKAIELAKEEVFEGKTTTGSASKDIMQLEVYGNNLVYVASTDGNR